MPNVVVYVKQRHADSFANDHAMKVWVREAVDRALSERGAVMVSEETSEHSERPSLAGQSASGVKQPPPRSESDTHFRPDPKPTKAEKKGRR